MTNDLLYGVLLVVIGVFFVSLWIYHCEAFLGALRRAKPEYRWLVLRVPGTIFFPELFEDDGEPVRRRCVRAAILALLTIIVGLAFYLGVSDV